MNDDHLISQSEPATAPSRHSAAYDYLSYGSFKGSTAATPHGWLVRAARKLGLRNRYLRFVRDRPRNEPLIEIGCGNGAFMREVLDAGFERVVGLEPSPSYAPVVDPGLIVRAYAQEFFDPLAQGSIGTVVALDVFEHIPAVDLSALLRCIESRLAPGGALVIRVPNLASPLSLFNFFGDLSHTTPLNEMSMRQLAHDTQFGKIRFHAEPFAYPRTLAAVFGIVIWGIYRLTTCALLAAFGVKAQVLTPNLICVLTKDNAIRAVRDKAPQ